MAIARDGLQHQYPPGRSKRDARPEMERLFAWIWRLEELRNVLDEDLIEVTPARDEQMAPERAQADRVLETARALAVEAAGRLQRSSSRGQPRLAGLGRASDGVALDDLYAGTLTPLDDADLGDNASFGLEGTVPVLPVTAVQP